MQAEVSDNAPMCNRYISSDDYEIESFWHASKNSPPLKLTTVEVFNAGLIVGNGLNARPDLG